MKVNQILKPFCENLEYFLRNFGDDTSDDDCFLCNDW